MMAKGNGAALVGGSAWPRLEEAGGLGGGGWGLMGSSPQAWIGRSTDSVPVSL